MKQVKWNDRFNIGIEEIDKQHRRLFFIVGKIIALNEEPDKQQHACQEGIKFLKSYALEHFAAEEAYMKSTQYSEYEIHRQLHSDMRDKTIPALEQELEANHYSKASVQHFLGICIGWLTAHIMIEDWAIAGKISQKWVHSPSEDLMGALERAALQSMSDLFHVKGQTVSRHYSGEDFSSGNAICFRFTYRSPDPEGGKRLIFMLYEDQMVLRTLSEMVDREVKRVDKTVIDVLKFMSQKFMERMARHFPPEETFLLEKIDMLTYEQLLRYYFEKDYPTYSMLFSANGKGYLGFCIK